MPKIKISGQTIVDLIVIGTIIMVASGCSLINGEGGRGNNATIAGLIYNDVKDDNGRITMLRKEVFEGLRLQLGRYGPGEIISVRKLFEPLLSNKIKWEPLHISLIRQSIRSHIRAPETVIQPKVVNVANMRKIIQIILNDYYMDSLSGIIPTWSK